MLNLNVINAFFTVFHKRHIHDLKMKKISAGIINGVSNFLMNKTTILTINRRKCGVFSMVTGVFQGFSFFFILYLFYNTNLLTTCNATNKRALTMNFADDINILIYERSTKANCQTLQKLHEVCVTGARTHETSFSPIKYELLHLTKNIKKFNMKTAVNIEGNIIKPKNDIRILRLQFDSKLK